MDDEALVAIDTRDEDRSAFRRVDPAIGRKKEMKKAPKYQVFTVMEKERAEESLG